MSSSWWGLSCKLTCLEIGRKLSAEGSIHPSAPGYKGGMIVVFVVIFVCFEINLPNRLRQSGRPSNARALRCCSQVNLNQAEHQMPGL
ncbi:hypothetical protein PoB_005740900 [Plakobranchus ocellatus]|uniref:Uncharacterized protein n=1 Tax=Plakobranchus ocellatus TaxID=259542 RepID=A0AAV4CE33_9GAST|nr:hypothetical protein PoB_005740900 [Plakobranchus ocellatus]